MTAALSSSQLAELAVEPVIGSWAEAVEQETLGSHTEGTKDGIKTVTDTVSDASGKYKVITTFKLVTKKVPRPVAERKKWKKFGACEGDVTGPQVATTFVAEEVQMQFVRNRFGEQQLDAGEETSKTEAAKAASVTHCRYCKSDNHWSVECPYKAMYVRHEDESGGDGAEKDLRGTQKLGVYVPPGARDGRLTAGGAMRSEENTCRVTNLPEECDEQELRHLFNQIGTVTRVFIARDKHTNRPKGFAFVTYERRDLAEMAIQKLNGYKMDHLVLKVEWTRPNN